MPAEILLTVWSDSVLVSSLVWALLSIVCLYLARSPAHELIDHCCQALARVLAATGRLLRGRALRAAVYNRQALRAAAEDLLARRIERRFQRVAEHVTRDLAGYPNLHRSLSEQIGRIDADYRAAANAPPTPPAWLDAIAAVAGTDAHGDPAVARILRDMHATLEAACHQATLDFRVASQRRYRSLRRLQPYLRRVDATLAELRRQLTQLEHHGAAIDSHMQAYLDLRTWRRDARRALALALPLRLGIGLALLAFAGVAALLNHQLVAPALAALTATPLDGAWTASGVLMVVELGIGVCVAELTGATRLLDLPDRVNATVRRRLAAAGLLLLGLLALLQSALAWAGTDAAVLPALPWLAPLAAALLAGMLPFVFALAALPLEAVLQSGRILLGRLVAALFWTAAALLQLTATVAAALAAPLRTLYDLWIFLPLWLDGAVRSGRARAGG